MAPAVANAHDVLRLGPFIPVVTIDDAGHAADLARALVAGGVRSIEVTLRTPAALKAIEAIAAHVPDIVAGAGTILSAEDMARARDAGARFGVSPGGTPELFAAARDIQKGGFPYLPAAVTGSEIISARAAGYTALKFFPAKSSGGLDALKNFAPVFADVVFCPTGGIGLADAPAWLALPNVACFGGAWATPPDLIRTRDWKAIEAKARAAAALKVG